MEKENQRTDNLQPIILSFSAAIHPHHLHHHINILTNPPNPQHLSYLCYLFSVLSLSLCLSLCVSCTVWAKMGRKCSQCGSIGHNSRTCSGYRARLSSPTSSAAAAAVAAPLTGNKGGLRLFGVQLDLSSISTPTSPSHSPSSSSSSRMDNNMKKSFSLDSLSPSHLSNPDDNKISDGYLSDGLTGGFQEKRKGEFLVENWKSFRFSSSLRAGDRELVGSAVVSRTCLSVFVFSQKWKR